ncbi:MAG: tetratricopeptide repeat protein [Candidatus Woesearchaeota archaeon]
MKKLIIMFMALLLAAPVLADIPSGAVSFALFKLGNHYYNNNDVHKAEMLYLGAIKISPEFGPAYYNMGVISYDQSQNLEAREWFLKAIEENSDYAQAEYSLGILLFEEKQHKEAVTHFRRAVELEPSSNRHFDLAIALVEVYRAGEEDKSLLQEALSHFEQSDNEHAKGNAEVITRLI